MKKLFTLFLLIPFFFACKTEGPVDPDEPVDDFNRQSMLAIWADQIIIPYFQNFEAEMIELQGQTITFQSDPSSENLADLRQSWLDAYMAWQRISMFETGKAEEIGFRNAMNIYPINAADIEENITNGGYNLELPSNLDAQGLPAVDYLLYGIGENEEEILSKFANPAYTTYLVDVINRMVALTATVVDDWEGGYRDVFVQNSGNSATASVDKMTNDYIFYYEKFLRAGKIGIPAGVFSGNLLPDRVEGFYSKVYSKMLFMEGLDAAQDFFNGVYADGSDSGQSLRSYLDYLNTIKDGEDLSTLINNQFDAARAQGALLNDNFALQIEQDNTAMLSTYDQLQMNVVLIKVDMLQALNVNVDFVDADGD
ncbi:MAG: imelysin family protein [Bacteroidota bacterium]